LTLKTRMTELLGIKHPIIQGAMTGVAFPRLVAAVSEAGGLGILGAAAMKPEAVRNAIREIKKLTSKPFGVNLIPESPNLAETLDVMIEEKVKVASFGVGNPEHVIRRTKPAGILSIPTVGSVKHAIKAEQDGADAVIVQGTEAGGHCSMVGTMVLVPATVDKVKIPVIAAGGFCDARGLIAAMSLGAEGISMGTRFILTKESMVSQKVKEKYLQSEEKDTIVTPHITGTRCRVLNNRLISELLRSGESVERSRESLRLGVEKISKAFADSDPEMVPLVSGQVIGLIKDIPSCKELIDSIINDAEKVLSKILRNFTTQGQGLQTMCYEVPSSK